MLTDFPALLMSTFLVFNLIAKKVMEVLGIRVLWQNNLFPLYLLSEKEAMLGSMEIVTINTNYFAFQDFSI